MTFLTKKKVLTNPCYESTRFKFENANCIASKEKMEKEKKHKRLFF